jgi:type I restriction enzyme S subunit
MGIPSPSEQAAIADFLDNETARIDRMIETKTRMLAALAERKDSAAIMCLSDGVDAFEWQPDKQEFAFRFKRPGWTAMRVKAVVSFMTSGSRGWSGLLGTEGEAFIQSGNIGRMMEVDVSSAQRVAPQVGAEAKRTRVRKHDVLVCITGGRTGAVGYVRSIDERAYINQHVCLLRARSQVLLPELLAQLLWSDLGQKQFGQRQYGVKQGIGFNELADLIVPVPCPEAQPHLVERINTETAKLDKLMLALQASIDRLNELRGSIITATVTGTLDISAWRKGNMTQRQLATVEAGT